MVLVLVLRWIERGEGSIASARRDHRGFEREVDELLQDGRHAAEIAKGGRAFLYAANDPLAFAVVAEPPCFQYCLSAESCECFLRIRFAQYVAERRGRDPKVRHKALLHEPVLCGRERAGIRGNRNVVGQKMRGRV